MATLTREQIIAIDYELSRPYGTYCQQGHVDRRIQATGCTCRGAHRCCACCYGCPASPAGKRATGSADRDSHAGRVPKPFHCSNGTRANGPGDLGHGALVGTIPDVLYRRAGTRN
ncbi:hypothetical protein AXI85_gp21 [Ralstonia phage RS138]|uniref:hypothetical protein n=1 Tax=Ralstonia phage RS138 TaxID=1483485 RepID=UPI0006BCE2F2|nr:hypothetical protein AXI85_gp21 [Ralstonia phage RS138]BAS32819.1 hypothetical protein [Ralstonia phage RS138]